MSDPTLESDLASAKWLQGTKGRYLNRDESGKDYFDSFATRMQKVGKKGVNQKGYTTFTLRFGSTSYVLSGRYIAEWRWSKK